jgi:PHS family inorganic phosphate transporter-like MFS transporter
MLSIVFLAQGLGKLAAMGLTIAVLSPILSAISQTTADNPSELDVQGALDRAWRLVIGCGSIPAIITLCYRLTIPESPRYRLDVLEMLPDKLGTSPDENKIESMVYGKRKKLSFQDLWQFLSSFSRFIRTGSVWKVLLGTSMSWFFLDFAFYGLGMNRKMSITAIFINDNDPTSNHPLFYTLADWRIHLIHELPGGAILGGILALFVLGRTGGQRLQMVGFVALGAIFLVTSLAYYQRGTLVGGRDALIVMYTAAQLAFNLGKNPRRRRGSRRSKLLSCHFLFAFHS